MEIVSLVGTFAVRSKIAAAASASGNECPFHLHVAASDAAGTVYGGHLVSGTVHTTVELVLGSIAAPVHFDRVHDPTTGYSELVVSSSLHATKEGGQHQEKEESG